MIVPEAAGGAPGPSTLSSYRVIEWHSDDDTLETISKPVPNTPSVALGCDYPRRPQLPHARITTSQVISLLRADLWASAFGLPNKNGFAAPHACAPRPLFLENNLQSAVYYASGLPNRSGVPALAGYSSVAHSSAIFRGTHPILSPFSASGWIQDKVSVPVYFTFINL